MKVGEHGAASCKASRGDTASATTSPVAPRGSPARAANLSSAAPRGDPARSARACNTCPSGDTACPGLISFTWLGGDPANSASCSYPESDGRL